MRAPILMASGLAGFALGIFTRSFFVVPTGVLVILAATGGVSFLLYIPRRARIFLLLGAAYCGVAAGIFRYDWNDRTGRSSALDERVGSVVEVRGSIRDEPDERDTTTRLILEASAVRGGAADAWNAVASAKILLIASKFPEFSYGDIVEARGRLDRPESFSDFDYRAYLAKDDVYWQMTRPAVEATGVERGAWFRRALFSVKRAYLDSLSRVLPEPDASFLGGLTVGARKAIPAEVINDFRIAGTLHMLVLSGYNVTIIARVLAALVPAVFPAAARIMAGLGGILTFALLAGASSTVVRASIMAAILYGAGITGRVYDARRALWLAGFIMLAWNPKLLRFDLSFQLSFLATLGLLYIAPRVERYFLWLPKRFGLREYGIATMSAQIAVTPLLLHSMGTLSLVAFPANIAALGAVPLTMLAGFLAGAVGFISTALAAPFAWIAYALSSYELGVMHAFAALPFAQIFVGRIPGVAMILAYIALGALFLKKRLVVVQEGKPAP